MNHRSRTRAGALAPVALAAFLAGAGAYAQAQPPASTPEQRRQASAAFDSGMAARASRDFTSAANYFETADRLAPNPSALGNAIEAHRSLHTASHNARAATLALRLLARYSSNNRLSAYANHIIEELSPGLTRVNVNCHSCDLEIDGALASYTDFFVEPGAHTVTATWSGNRNRSHEFTAAPNGSEDVNLEPPSETPAPPVTPPAGPSPGNLNGGSSSPPGSEELPPGMRRPGGSPPPGAEEHPGGSSPGSGGGGGGLPPAVFITGAGATVVLAGILVWSGLDALAGVPAYESDPTPAALADGQGRELRTNILIGATAAVGALTVASLFFTRWSGGNRPPPVEAAPVVTSGTGALPGLTLRGRF